MTIRGIFALLALGVAAVAADQELVAIVHLVSYDSNYNVTGDITLTQSTSDGPVRINGTIYGLSGGYHGFHVHQTGDLSNGCTSALGHFNPDNQNHGAPEDTVRHVGDLGNIVASDDGIAVVDISDSVISLNGNNNILGRSIVVHAGTDDLGKGNHALSLTTGNAGDRAACGVIGVLSPVDRWSSGAGRSFHWSGYMILLSVGTLVLGQTKF